MRCELACSEFSEPAQGLVHAERTIERAGRSHLHGLRLAGLTLRIEHALALGQSERVRDDVPLVMTLRESYESHAMYRCRVAWAAIRAQRELAEPGADRLLEQEAAWIRRTAADQVGASFVPSFLERNPSNRALLAAASQSQRRDAGKLPQLRGSG